MAMSLEQAVEILRREVFELRNKLGLLTSLTGQEAEVERLWSGYLYNQVGMPAVTGIQKGNAVVNLYPTPKVSVITPASRGTRYLHNLLDAMHEQTYRDFEHIIIYDGPPNSDVKELLKDHPGFIIIPKSPDKHPGTTPRNEGIKAARGEWLCFADDDDHYNDNWIQMLVTGAIESAVTLTQASFSMRRIKPDADKKKQILLPDRPEIVPGRIGTPCFMVRREHALECPWQDEPNHDFWFLKRIIDKFNLTIQFHPGCTVVVQEHE